MVALGDDEGPLTPLEPSDSLADWLAGRLLEERQLLERRHAAICGLVLQELRASGHARTPRRDASARKIQAPLDVTADPPPCPPPRLIPKQIDKSRSELTSTTKRTSELMTNAKITVQQSYSAVRSVKIPRERQGLCKAFESFVLGGPFETMFALLIVLNAAVMAVEVQHSGLQVGRDLNYAGVQEAGPMQIWVNSSGVFHVFENMFGVVFTIEVVLKVAVMRQRFFCVAWNVFDTLIVAAWVGQEVYGSFGVGPNPMVLRVCRLVRLLRLLRLMKMTSMFDTLVLMVSSIRASAAVLFWGMVLLFFTMSMCAFIINSSVSSFMLDREHPEHIRLQLYGYFGTYTRSMVTMFEVTLASWVNVCRLFTDNISEYWAIFFVFYKGVVGFAVLKVITGVFLHETFRCASMDDDLMVQQRRRMRGKFKKKMLKFFEKADIFEQGEVTVDEFVRLIADDRVNTWLEAMDLRVRDVGAERVFAFLAGTDHRLSRDELCTGMSRLRGPAQGLDVVTLLEIAAPDIKLPISRDIERLREVCDTVGG